MKGYLGKVLKVDLTTGEIADEAITDSVYENVLSGIGLGAYYLYNNIPADADPLGPDNILGLTSGMLVGTGSLVTGRWMAVCKSPLTGGWGDANCGGDFAPAIKACGYDAIFFKGISPSSQSFSRSTSRERGCVTPPISGERTRSKPRTSLGRSAGSSRCPRWLPSVPPARRNP